MIYAKGYIVLQPKAKESRPRPTPYWPGRQQKGLYHSGFSHSLTDTGQIGYQAITLWASWVKRNCWQPQLYLSAP